MPPRPLLYLIDGSSQMYRAYHAPVRTAEGGLLRNAQGTPTNAVYIFVNMLRKLLNEHKPEFIAASFDLPGRTFRDDLVDDYKANRAPMPSELAQQIPMVHAACEALGKNFEEHVANYGAEIEHRLTGSHETAPWSEFSYGVSNRGASVRIPWQVEIDKKGYIEDRRPNANMDPYVVTRMIVDTCCSALA